MNTWFNQIEVYERAFKEKPKDKEKFLKAASLYFERAIENEVNKLMTRLIIDEGSHDIVRLQLEPTVHMVGEGELSLDEDGEPYVDGRCFGWQFYSDEFTESLLAAMSALDIKPIYLELADRYINRGQLIVDICVLKALGERPTFDPAEAASFFDAKSAVPQATPQGQLSIFG